MLYPSVLNSFWEILNFSSLIIVISIYQYTKWVKYIHPSSILLANTEFLQRCVLNFHNGLDRHSCTRLLRPPSSQSSSSWVFMGHSGALARHTGSPNRQLYKNVHNRSCTTSRHSINDVIVYAKSRTSTII